MEFPQNIVCMRACPEKRHEFQTARTSMIVLDLLVELTWTALMGLAPTAAHASLATFPLDQVQSFHIFIKAQFLYNVHVSMIRKKVNSLFHSIVRCLHKVEINAGLCLNQPIMCIQVIKL